MTIKGIEIRRAFFPLCPVTFHDEIVEIFSLSLGMIIHTVVLISSCGLLPIFVISVSLLVTFILVFHEHIKWGEIVEKRAMIHDIFTHWQKHISLRIIFRTMANCCLKAMSIKSCGAFFARNHNEDTENRMPSSTGGMMNSRNVRQTISLISLNSLSSCFREFHFVKRFSIPARL